jgi:aryl-alcohol dehydrogenase-like predicted oxidoreductase
MHYRFVGGRRSSVLCLGAMYFGSTINEATSFSLLDRFVERGGNFIDTANCYCFWIGDSDGGDSERLVGRWLNARGMRDEVTVATKIGALPAGPGEWPDNREGLSGATIRRGVSSSLDRLGVDRIDLLYGHIDDPSTSLAETVVAFSDTVREGKVAELGMSNQSIERFASSRDLAGRLALPRSVALQQRHTYLQPAPQGDFEYQVPLDEPILAYARTQPDLTVLAFSVLLSGAYTDPAKPLPPQYQHSGTDRALAVLREVATEAGATPNQVIYAWMLGGSPAIVPIIGVSQIQQLDEAIDAVDLELTPDQCERLNRARAGDC